MSAVSLELRNIVQEYAMPGAGGGGTGDRGGGGGGEGAGGSNRVRVVDDVSLTFDRPGVVMLLGPSGCGKSTLLRMMGGVRPMGVKTPTSGEVFIDGVASTDQHDDVVMVFQRYANRPDLSARENIAFPFRLKLWRQKVSREEAKSRVDAMLASVRLDAQAELRPAQLSGGQNQRVALARALVLRPRILLMDEPFGALDAQTREEMQRLLIDLYREHPCLVVFVTHDVTEALVLGDRVVVLSGQPAKVADDFEIAEPRPRSSAWQRSSEAQAFEERILATLHARGAGGSRGQVRVTV